MIKVDFVNSPILAKDAEMWDTGIGVTRVF